MIGYDAISQVAIASISADATDAIIFAPEAVAVATTIAAPVIRAGASVAVPVGPVNVTAPVPSVRTGVLATVQCAGVAVTSASAAVRISATITASAAAAVAVSANPPLILAGASVNVPVAPVLVTSNAAFVTAGKYIATTTTVITVSAPVAGISISAKIWPPMVAVAVGSDPVQVLTGTYIEASNSVTHTTALGEIGSSSIGEFAIGEGEPETHTHIRGIFVLVSTPETIITAGKSIFPPATNINVTSERAEIESRRRKLRVLAIAS